MVPVACAVAMYFASTAGVDSWSIQYAVGVLTTALSWGFGGSKLRAARMPFDSGLT